MKYQSDGLNEETRLPVGRVVSDVELIPGSMNSIRIDLSGLDKPIQEVTIVACQNSCLPQDVAITDMLVKVDNGEANLLVYNRLRN